MTEIHEFAVIVLLVGTVLSVAVVSTKLADLAPIPAPVVLMVAAALVAGVSSPVGDALDIRDVERVSVVALIVILVNGGMEIGWGRLRGNARAVLSLGVLGTFITAGVTAAGAHFLLGFDWKMAGVLGAALAPTDPAVMFSVLGGRSIRGRTNTLLEGEAGFNDPAGIALMIGMIELATEPSASFWIVITDFTKEMVIGGAVGVIGGRALVLALRNVRLSSEPLYPIFVLLLAAVLYGVAGTLGGSGFLAVFLAGLTLTTVFDVPQRAGIHSAAGFSEVVVFVALGLTVGILDLPASTWAYGAVLILVVALVARPLAVAVTLAPAQLTRNERLFVTWSGLKGAVPILLAVFAVIGDVPRSQEIYGIVFVVVALSVAVQGSLVPAVASRLHVTAER